MANAWRWVVVFSSKNLHSFSVMAAGVQPCLGDVTMASFLIGSTMIALKSSPENKLSMTLAVDILSGGETPILLTENTPFIGKYPIDFSTTCTCSMKPNWWWIWNSLLCWSCSPKKYLTQPRCFLIQNLVFHKFSNTYLESILFQKYRFLNLLADDLALTIGFHHDQTQNDTASYIWKRHSFNNKKTTLLRVDQSEGVSFERDKDDGDDGILGQDRADGNDGIFNLENCEAYNHHHHDGS